MKHSLPARTALLLPVLLGATLALAQDSELSVLCKPPSAKAKAPRLRLEGAAPFPDNTVLKISLHRVFEDYGVGQIVSTTVGVGGGAVEVKGRKFLYEPAVEGPAPYSIQVTYMDELQRPAILEQLKGKVAKRQWKFDFMAWTDDMIPLLGPRLEEIAVFQKECVDMLKRFEDATASEANWKVQAKDLTAANAKLLRKLELSEAKPYFPASLNQIFYTIRSVQGTSPYFNWENGKFAGGKSYHADNQEIKSHRNEPYTFPNLKKYVDESVPLAGREMGLWLVKDIKRAGLVRPDVTDAVKKYAAHPGLAYFAERIGAATPADLEALEKDLRSQPLSLEPDPKKK